ncbi:hypothetical protein CRUP_032444 [Coryphaenoides rupestris]|nr:hypothetical protein CRUP_032444 [Coryphaenoides rupestris]
MSSSSCSASTEGRDTLAALQEFYSETCAAPDGTPADKFALGAVGEDWGMSQFWYDDETATRLAEEVIHEAGDGGRIACVSAPSVYQKLKQGVVDGSDRVSAVVLEFDRRFAAYGDDFVFYDYNDPLALPAALQGGFDVVLADPPYLSQECLAKVAQTVKFLKRGKVLLCTGAIMEKHARDLLGLRRCDFLPRHKKNLANEFRCFASYTSRLLSC